MAAPSSPLLSPAVDTDDDTTGIPDSQAQSHDDVDISQGPEASRKDGPGPDSAPQPAQAQEGHPLQKRRRVTRACDECRRKKIKCNGKQPCTHCTVYSYGELTRFTFECCRPGRSLIGTAFTVHRMYL